MKISENKNFWRLEKIKIRLAEKINSSANTKNEGK
jgi:hypothetical protein